jgi:hypothetical protein
MANFDCIMGVYVTPSFFFFFFFVGELKQSLPSMVVDILETKLDDDYIEYIANMIAKKTSDECGAEDRDSDNRMEAWEDRGQGMEEEERQRIPADWPEHWEYMDARQVGGEITQV